MRNFVDSIQGLSALHTILSGIAAQIDAIPVPGGGGGGNTSYSSTPEVIGKWIDGETDVYRFVVTGISPSGNGTKTTYSLTDYLPDGMEIDQTIKVDWMVNRGTEGIDTGWFRGCNAYIAVNPDNMIVEYVSSYNFNDQNKPFYCIIECTMKASA